MKYSRYLRLMRAIKDLKAMIAPFVEEDEDDETYSEIPDYENLTRAMTSLNVIPDVLGHPKEAIV